MDQDVSSMMMGTFSGTERDEFGREHDARRSLLLDTVMKGRQRASRSRFLQMPAEILADVVDLLTDDKPALASLALVNSDCRQLARCCQFAEIHFDYSLRAHQLFMALATEATDTARQLGIGNCVRRVTFASDASCVANVHRELYESIFGEGAESYPKEQRESLREKAKQHYMSIRRLSLMAISTAMPNLEVLVWGDRFSLDEAFFSNVSRSSARHIKLNRVLIGNPFPMEPPLTLETWPLRSLDLDMSWLPSPSIDRAGSDEQSQGTQESDAINPMSAFFGTLFQLCAPSLESLNWAYMDFSKGKVISLGSNPISFPHLQHLRLGYVPLDALGFSSFLSSPLRHLELSSSVLTNFGSSLRTCGPLQDLKSFVIDTLPTEKKTCKHITEFIIQHKHIEKLYLHERGETHDEDRHLDRYIIPLLTNDNFNHLRSLSLAWGGGSIEEITKPHITHIPEKALATIGKIVSLEQLSLCSGMEFGWRNQWLVDHTELRTSLQGLSNLKMLALVRDTYLIPGPVDDVEQYYSVKLVRDGERADAKARMELDIDEAVQAMGTLEINEHDREFDTKAEIWERAHRNRMLTHVEAYAAVLPALEWMLCGQRPVGLERDPHSPAAPLKAVPLTKHRDECWTFLRKTFGIATSD
ncbi:hypothetical protein G7Z17_g1051 [Cylindrodendrum hubeiense]|uniref:F-box domain-containing protein n=1 Tax=Cylindrodendrum hubeiense TaxID=595255 RepID=A0A9P5HJ34_9HYPO|nr:hypothetical protein G7Z17_g1051 [Cylindrodendrum hubeiense]